MNHNIILEYGAREQHSSLHRHVRDGWSGLNVTRPKGGQVLQGLGFGVMSEKANNTRCERNAFVDGCFPESVDCFSLLTYLLFVLFATFLIS